jgi:hypothetical protein
MRRPVAEDHVDHDEVGTKTDRIPSIASKTGNTEIGVELNSCLIFPRIMIRTRDTATNKLARSPRCHQIEVYYDLYLNHHPSDSDNLHIHKKLIFSSFQMC